MSWQVSSKRLDHADMDPAHFCFANVLDDTFFLSQRASFVQYVLLIMAHDQNKVSFLMCSALSLRAI